MKFIYKFLTLTIVLLSLTIFVGCKNNIKIESSNNVFDFDKLNDIVFNVECADGEFTHIEGHNIADADYMFLDGKLVLKKEFLMNFSTGKYYFNLFTTKGQATFETVVKATHSKYKIINGGFETGDLTGWTSKTIFKAETQIQSFINEAIRPNETFFTFEAPYNGDGKFVFGFDDRDGENKDKWNERVGLMTSSVFELGGSGFISFKMGGAKNSDLTFISVRDLETDTELARYSNPKFNSTSFETDAEHYFEANLCGYYADLSSFLGKKMYIEVCDYGGRDWDLITLDSIVTYYKDAPTLSDFTLAVDTKPRGSLEVEFIPNNLPNADFLEGLKFWDISTAKGWQSPNAETTAFVTLDNKLKSNAKGDLSRGLIRSAPFRIDGLGIVSLSIGAACGSRYDKDTYVSIRLVNSNREIFRFANNRSNGALDVNYFADLSDYIGKNCYLEIVDNATNSYDTIFISNIKTYYENRPVYDFGQEAINLNY